ncbi:MAG: hypothetical protein WCC57_12235 [Paracoccaceae bacterium]
MKVIAQALTVMMLSVSPVLAQSVMIDLPRLTWPDEGTAPVSQGCVDPVTLGTTTCTPGQ